MLRDPTIEHGPDEVYRAPAPPWPANPDPDVWVCSLNNSHPIGEPCQCTRELLHQV